MNINNYLESYLQGKTRHCLKKYESEGFERICPKVHFLSNKSLGLRDISIRISRLLEKVK